METTTTRPAERRRMKAILKELKYIEKHTPYLSLMRDSDFSGLSKEEMALLQKGEHENKERQDRFTLMSQLFTRVVRLNEEYFGLKRSGEHPSRQEDTAPPTETNLSSPHGQE